MTRAFVPAERTQSTRCRASRIPAIIAAKIYSSTPRVVSSHIRVLDVGWVIVTRARAFLEGALLSLASMVSPRTLGLGARFARGGPFVRRARLRLRGRGRWRSRVGVRDGDRSRLRRVARARRRRAVGGGRPRARRGRRARVCAKDAALENGDEVFSVPADATRSCSRRAGKAINDPRARTPSGRSRSCSSASATSAPPRRTPRPRVAVRPPRAARVRAAPRHRPRARPSSPSGPGPDDGAAADRNPAAAAGFARLEDPSHVPPSAVAALEGAHAGRVLAALDAEFERAYDAVTVRSSGASRRRSRAIDTTAGAMRRALPSSARRRAFPRAADVRRVGDRTPREVARGGARPGRAPPRARPARRRAVRHRGGSGDGRVPLFRGGAAEGSNDGRRGARHGDRPAAGALVPRHRGNAGRPSSLAREWRGGRRRVGLGRRGDATRRASQRLRHRRPSGATSADAVRVTSRRRRRTTTTKRRRKRPRGMSRRLLRTTSPTPPPPSLGAPGRLGAVWWRASAAIRPGWRSSPTGPRRSSSARRARHRQ